MRSLVGAFCACLLLCLAPSAGAATYDSFVRNVLPPGQDGGIPATKHSTDQIKLYDSLTPLMGKVSLSAVKRYFKPAGLGTAGLKVTKEKVPRKGVTIVRDKWNVPHITGKTRDDVEFGAGWVAAEDRRLFMELVRGISRLTALDAPGVGDPVALGTTGRTFTPTAATDARIQQQSKLFAKFGSTGKRSLADVKAYVSGINAYYRTLTGGPKPWKTTDVFAVASLIGAVFGKSGGNEVANAQFLSALQAKLGEAPGTSVFRDLRSRNDAEAPTTLAKRFPFDLPATGATPGSPIVDAGSFSPVSFTGSASFVAPTVHMSNALLIGAKRTKDGHPIAVMGPQVAYFYPEFLLEQELHGGGLDARGAAFPGVSMWILLGRAKDYAWSATSPSSNNVDQYVEELCNPDGSPATRASDHYVYKGKCTAMTTFDAGTLQGGGKPIQEVVFHETVHGPVSGTATVLGKPYAVTSRRSTRGRDGLQGRAFMQLNENKVHSAKDFAKVMNQLEFTFNTFYVDDRDIAYFSTGRLPVRAPGTDADLPTLGTGGYEWRGWLSRSRHAQAINPSSGVILNWNNKPAPDFSASDTTWSYGPVQREQLFTGLKKKNRIQDVVSVMNNAATKDLRAVEVWPLIKAVLAGGPAPDGRSDQAAKLVDDYLAAGAHRLDLDNDGKIDAAGAAVLDAAWPKLSEAVLSPVLGPLTSNLAALATVDDKPAKKGSAYFGGWYGYVNKDLRSLLGRSVKSPYSRRYCGNGDLAACRTALWAAMQSAADTLAGAQGADPTKWRSDANAERIQFQPGLLGPNFTMRWANRPTFQQVVEFKAHRPR